MIYQKVQLLLLDLVTNTGVCDGQYRHLGIMWGIKIKRNFLNDESHVTLNPTARKGKVIKVDPMIQVTFVEVFIFYMY